MYYFFLGELPLPVTPGALSIKTPSMNKTITLINEGEVNLLKSPGLREISFEFLLPQHKYSWVNHSVGGNYTASVYIPLIKAMKENKTVFQFIVTRTAPNGESLFSTNITCAIESYTLDEDAAALGLDVKCSILLKEHKEPSTKSFSIINLITDAVTGVVSTIVGAVTSTRSTNSKTIPTTYTVQKGDTLWNICKQQLGDGQKYKEIATLNKLENPNKIYPGQVLRLK